MDFSWGSPVGLAAFMIGAGVFLWCVFHGLAAVALTKAKGDAPKR